MVEHDVARALLMRPPHAAIVGGIPQEGDDARPSDAAQIDDRVLGEERGLADRVVSNRISRRQGAEEGGKRRIVTIDSHLVVDQRPRRQ